MLVDHILDRKGRDVATVAPTTTVTEALRALQAHNVGALVVTTDGRQVEGIVSERDIVRGLAEHGADLLTRPVGDIMIADVQTCCGTDTADELMHRMTEHRIRHLPVVGDAGLAGIISIGDVVKTRVDELEREQSHLVDYIRSPY